MAEGEMPELVDYLGQRCIIKKSKNILYVCMESKGPGIKSAESLKVQDDRFFFQYSSSDSLLLLSIAGQTHLHLCHRATFRLCHFAHLTRA